MIPRQSDDADIAIRLLIWAALTLVTIFLVFDAVGAALGAGLANSPLTEDEWRSNMLRPTVAFALSLLPLFWPRSPWGLVLFGMVWAALDGLMLIALWRSWMTENVPDLGVIVTRRRWDIRSTYRPQSMLEHPRWDHGHPPSRHPINRVRSTRGGTPCIRPALARSSWAWS